MSSDWIQHVKQTQKDNGCSYKEAMVLAKQTYGGKLNVGKVFKTISRLSNQPKIREKLKADKRKLESQLQQQEALNKERAEKLAKYESSYKQQQEAQLGAVTSQQAMKKQLLDLQRENDALKNKPVVPQEEIPKMPIDNLADNTEGFLAKAKRSLGWGSGVESNPWLAHVKAYQAKHGCSYKEALKGAKATYKSQKCGEGVGSSKVAPVKPVELPVLGDYGAVPNMNEKQKEYYDHVINNSSDFDLKDSTELRDEIIKTSKNPKAFNLNYDMHIGMYIAALKLIYDKSVRKRATQNIVLISKPKS